MHKWIKAPLHATLIIISRISLFSRGGRVVRRCWVNFECLGVPEINITVRQEPTALTVGAGGGCLDIFTLLYPFSPLSPRLPLYWRRPDID